MDDVYEYEIFISKWLNFEYLHEIEDEIIHLDDYVPIDIECSLHDFDKRIQYIYNKSSIDISKLDELRIIDQRGSWDQLVNLYEIFFEKHPEYMNLIIDQKLYNDWKINGNN